MKKYIKTTVSRGLNLFCRTLKKSFLFITPNTIAC
jgi:hypothetical protein